MTLLISALDAVYLEVILDGKGIVELRGVHNRYVTETDKVERSFHVITDVY